MSEGSDVAVSHQFMIRSYLLIPYIEAVEARGISTQRLLATHRTTSEELYNPSGQLPFNAFLAITQRAAELVGDPCLGLRVGSEILPEQVGSLGLLMATSPTLGGALRQFSRWAASMHEGWSLELVEDGKLDEYIYRIELTGVPFRQDVEYSLANMVSLIRTRMGNIWAPQEVHFTHSMVGQAALYKRIFRAPVFFEQTHDKIVFASDELNRLSTRTNHALLPIIDAHFRALAAEGREEGDRMSRRVGQVMSRILGERPVHRDEVAAELGMSLRSLQRRLAEEGTNFRELLKIERQRLVERMIFEHEKFSLTDIALRAGYADGSALSRAYRQWTGASPSRVRQRLRSR